MAAPGPLRQLVLYTADPWESALPVLRVRGPAAVAGVNVIQGNSGDAVAPERVSLADLVVIQRDFPRFGAGYQAVMDRARAEGKPVVYELDDLLLELPEDHLAHGSYTDFLFAILRAVVEADLVIATTAPLCQYLQPFNAAVRLWPNALDDRLWPLRAPSRSSDPANGSRPVVIGYMGGPTHLPDLESMADSLRRVLDHYGGRVRCQFWGGVPPATLAEHSNVGWTPVDLRDYAEFARYFTAQACDIFVAPLRDNLFNRCKSAIKFLEYSALGVPGIYSRLDPYTGLVRHGENGLLAGTPEEWEQGLSLLVESAGLRQQLASQAQQTVEACCLLSQRAADWLDAYQVVLAPGYQRPLPEPHRQVFVRVAQQVQPRHRALEEHVQALREQAKELEVRRRELEAIYSSPAWRLAQRLGHLRARLAPDGSRRQRLLDALATRRMRRP